MRLDQLLSIDLRAHGADVKVVNWTGASQESVPSRFGDEFPPEAVSAFRTELGPAGEPCLVAGATGGDAWISPRYGMVRAAEPGKFLRELVCATD
jgi:hypothetical protein